MSGHHWQTLGDKLLAKITSYHQRDGSVHWPTVTAILANLAGEYALLSRVTTMPESGLIQSDEVLHLISGKTRNSSLYGYAEILAEQAYGVSLEHMPTFEDTLGQVGFKLVQGDYPDYMLPANVMPQVSPLTIAPLHRAEVNKIASEVDAEMSDIAFSLMTAAMKSVGFVDAGLTRGMATLALQSLVAGARFVPALATRADIATGPVSEMLERLSNGSITPPNVLERKDNPQANPVFDDSQAENPEPARAFGRRR